MKYIDELEKEDIKGKRVLLRLDLNVPILNGEIMDTHRLDRTIETVDFLRQMEAKTIIISHCEGKEPNTLVPMWQYLKGYFPVEFSSTYFTPEAIGKVLELKNKDIILFENVRAIAGEKENNPNFAKKLAGMADLYVNDAFSGSHRRHASIVGVPEFLPHYGGLLMRQEIEHLSKIFNPNRPFVFILGGAKFDTKSSLIKKYLDKADHVFVGGAIANDIFKAKGFEVGISLLSEGDLEAKDALNNPKLVIPRDVTVRRPDNSIQIKFPDSVLVDEYIVDVGPETIVELKKLISGSKTVVWNGPLGKYKKGFRDKSENLAEIIAEATEKLGVSSIIGGGDTIAAINMSKLNHKFSFVSTGGGAMVDYLINETLPGIEALEK